MPSQRKTIPIATSALLFVCLMLHAQAGLSAQTLSPYYDAEAYKVYESLLPNDWTGTVAHARRLIKARTGSYPSSAHRYIPLSRVAFNADNTVAVASNDHTCSNLCGGGTSNVFAKNDGVWKNMRWMGTSRAWAS